MTEFQRRRWLPDWLRTLVRCVVSRDARADWRWERVRRRAGRPALPSERIQRVVVICYGNICRSPVAGLDLARRRPELEVRSAGLSARDGKPAEPGARRRARALDLDLEGHRAQLLRDGDVEWADLILGMQGRHVAEVRRRWPRAAAKVRLLGDFLDAPPFAIEDPWGQPDEAFDRVYAKIMQANERLVAVLSENGR